MQTLNGQAFDLLEPDAATVDFSEIAHALARIPRFLGHTRGAPYSVAQHCVLGARALAEETGDAVLAACFLLHDAHEAYIGDFTTPVKEALADVAGGPEGIDVTRGLQVPIDREIYAAAGLDFSACMRTYKRDLADMDLRLLRLERDTLMTRGARRWHRLIEEARPIPALNGIEPWPYDVAELAYRNALQTWLPQTLRSAA